MKYVNAFFKFWYGFFIGDAWELAAGVVITLVVVALLVAALPTLVWVLFPVGIAITLSASVLFYGRAATKSQH